MHGLLVGDFVVGGEQVLVWVGEVLEDDEESRESLGSFGVAALGEEVVGDATGPLGVEDERELVAPSVSGGGCELWSSLAEVFSLLLWTSPPEGLGDDEEERPRCADVVDGRAESVEGRGREDAARGEARGIRYGEKEPRVVEDEVQVEVFLLR